MQKVDIILNGPDEEPCAELIKNLADMTMRHFDVVPVNIFCGKAPVKKGYGELLVPEFIQRLGKPEMRRTKGKTIFSGKEKNL